MCYTCVQLRVVSRGWVKIIELEKRYNGLAVEREMHKYWFEHGIYNYVPDRSRPLYSIDTPPPTVNGSLHIGHIFSYTQAEMIARYRRMRGYNVFYPFGFDDNGLPSERLVERETGLRACDMPRNEFCDKCVEVTGRYESEFMLLWKSMGFSCDWNLQYSTCSLDTQRLSQKSFLELVHAGHAYIKESPVLWCTECQTSIAQAELDSKDVESYFHYIPFTVEGEVLEIATTRPELLPGVVCVFVNPEDKRYSASIGKNVKVPLYDFEVPLLADEKVAIDKGTGAVMCATFGDSTDVEWVNQYDLPYKKIILSDGTISSDIKYIAGLKVKAAREEIVRLLESKGLLIRSERLFHVVSGHERCGTEVEIISSRQWYIDVLSKRAELIAAGDKILWYPSYMKSRYISWVENLKWDWCISRQRYFGIPIPVWYCASCGKPVFAKFDQLPINPIEMRYEGACECGHEDFVPDRAVLDTWATSSISPIINSNTFESFGGDSEAFLPMSMRTQAHEIIRTWAFYTIVKSLYHSGDVPWKEIMVCGFVLAKPGEKISKSKLNSKLSPQELIKEYSADAIRYWAANAKLGSDTFFDIQEMKDSSMRLITKLWNSSKFVISHLHDFDPDCKLHNVLPIDRWIIERTHETIIQAIKYLDEYEIGLARKLIDDFFWKDMCDYYIEIVKDRLYKPEVHGQEERRSAQSAIHYCFLNVLKMYAIYIPHETEYIYLKGFKQFTGVLSIHLTGWPKPTDVNTDILKFGEMIKAAIAKVRKYKSEKDFSMKTEIEMATIDGSEKFRNWFKETESDFCACTRAQKVIYNLL